MLRPCAPVEPAQQPPGPIEEFPKLDPYTRGQRPAFDKAGYISLGPFLLAGGITTRDVEAALGNIPVLWIETEHFRLGSTLPTYKLPGDSREDRRLKSELGKLKARFDRFTPPQGKLDPWLRAHLSAWRLEELYARFQKQFGLSDADFDPARTPDTGDVSGKGRYLGMESKFSVLLFESASSLARFSRQVANEEREVSGRWRLPGGTLCLALSADGVRSLNFELESALTCYLAGEVMTLLLEGLNESNDAAPLWLRYGLAHVASREVDPRWGVAAVGTTREFGDASWKWEPRVLRIVMNKAAVAWNEMSAWDTPESVSAQGHLLAWSRTQWLLKQDPSDLRKFILSVCTPLPAVPEKQRRELVTLRVAEAVQGAMGKTLESIDAEWRAFVLKNYSK